MANVYGCCRLCRPAGVLACWFVVGLAGAARPALGHDVPAEMRAAATRFLQPLTAAQREQVSLAFDHERRTAWHYIPSSMMESHGGRRGLAIKDMTPDQQALAHGLLSTALSHPGYLQAVTIMALESILRDLEGGNPARDPEQYHVAVHGTPSPTDTWGWSFEGHHLSVNVTLVNGQQFAVTPSFFGSNPAVVPDGTEGLGDSRRRTTVGPRTRSLAQPGAAETGDHCRGGTERDLYGSSTKWTRIAFCRRRGFHLISLMQTSRRCCSNWYPSSPASFGIRLSRRSNRGHR